MHTLNMIVSLLRPPLSRIYTLVVNPWYMSPQWVHYTEEKSTVSKGPLRSAEVLRSMSKDLLGPEKGVTSL